MMYNICVNKNATSPGINKKEFFDSNNKKTSPAKEKKRAARIIFLPVLFSMLIKTNSISNGISNGFVNTCSISWPVKPPMINVSSTKKYTGMIHCFIKAFISFINL